MGGGQVPQQPAAPPAPPSAGETSAQAIQAQIDALPKILAAQQQYGDQFSQLNLDSLKKYGPEFADAALKLEQQFAPQYKAISDTLNPEIGAAQNTLTSYLNGNDQQEYDALAPGLLDQVRAGQSQRGIGAISPLGSIDESIQLQQLKQSLKDRRLNIALSTAGRTPISGIANIQGTNGTGQLVNNVNPDSIFNYQQGLNNFNASIFGTQANIYGTNYNNTTTRRGQNLSFIQGMTGSSGPLSESGAGGTALAGAYLFCWVASEVFGEPMDSPKVSSARNFILNNAPEWFIKMYAKSGKKIAEFIHDKEEEKNIIRPLFEYFSKKGSVSWDY